MFFKKSVFKYFLAVLCIYLCSVTVRADEASDLASDIAGQKRIMAEEMNLIVEQHMGLGSDFYSQGEYDNALEEFNTVLDIDNNNKEAKDWRMKCISAIANKGAVSSVSGEDSRISVMSSRQAGAVSAYREGLQAYRSGRNDLAVQKLRLACALDPYYKPSKRLLKTVLEILNESIDRDHDILWNERINEVRKAWMPTGRANKITLDTDEFKEAEIITDAKRKMIMASEQLIPEINFTQAHLRDVLQYLSKITGVNIILDERVFEAGFATYSMPADTSEEADMMKQVSSAPMTDTITISLTNIPLIEALRYILKIKGLKYRIDDYAIMVSTPEGIGDEEMETRYYHLSSGIAEFTEFKTNDAQANTGIGRGAQSGSFGGEGLEVESRTSIRDVLMNSGVPFPPGSNVFMDKRTGTLIVHNTPENLTMVERILEIIDKAPFQVNIQAKFVRISQSDLEEMGFEWLLKSPVRVGDAVNGQNKWQIDQDSTTENIFVNNSLGNTSYIQDGVGTFATGAVNGIVSSMPNFVSNSSILAFSGILTDPQFRVIMHALDKNGNTDLLSAPSVTTVNNQQAQIELVDEIIYPSEYDLQPPTISENGSTITPGISVPGDFVTRDVGVILNVTPSVGSDRKTITLTLIPEVSELIGWKDFGVTYRNTISQQGGYLSPIFDAVGEIIGYGEANESYTSEQHIPIEQPIFRTSNVSTTVVVNDGETVVLGGLIEEKKRKVNDKVPLLGDIPLLGRLFRHSYEQSDKMNLMIFVTAKLINANGEDLHPSRKTITT